jgi:hypothetical protein
MNLAPYGNDTELHQIKEVKAEVSNGTDFISSSAIFSSE